MNKILSLDSYRLIGKFIGGFSLPSCQLFIFCSSFIDVQRRVQVYFAPRNILTLHCFQPWVNTHEYTSSDSMHWHSLSAATSKKITINPLIIYSMYTFTSHLILATWFRYYRIGRSYQCYADLDSIIRNEYRVDILRVIPELSNNLRAIF